MINLPSITRQFRILATSLFCATFLQASPVAHYEFEEISGTVLVDTSSNGHNGSVVGSGDLNVSGILGSAYQPGGNGSYGKVVNGVSTFGIGGNNARTIAFWFRTPDFGDGNDQYRLIGIGTGAGSAFNIVAESGTNAGGVNRIGLRYGNGNVYFDADNNGALFATNTWYHVAVVYDGTTLDLETIGTASDATGLTFYVNGVEANSAGGNLNNPNQALDTALTDFVFGANPDGSDVSASYPGILDDVRVHGSALSAAEISTLASAAGTLPVVQSFTASETLVDKGSTVTLSWSASNYETLIIQPGDIDAAALTTNGSGSTQVVVNETTTYRLTAGNEVADVFNDVEVTVQGQNLGSFAVKSRSMWTKWYRPVDSPVFSTSDGNNHDPILFYEPTGSAYKYYLIISHESSNAFLWGTNTFSWNSADWTLIDGNYQISSQYEFDDGVKVDGTYYIYEAGKVFTYTGDLANSSGNWTQAGNFPASQCDDIGVFYEDGLFHIFGEHGNFPYGPDGTSLSHYSSPTGLGNWTLVDNKAVDPNPDGGDAYGVGDATIAKVGDIYYLFCDLETQDKPYRVISWSSTSLDQPFTYLGVAMEPREGETDDWDNYRIQDADIQYIPELKRFIMVCNMMDTDGSNPDNVPPFLGGNATRVVGTFYSKVTDGGFDVFMEGFPGLIGADALADADPDNDGATNGEEYAGGSLPDDAGSFPGYEMIFLEDEGVEYPALVFDRITVDSQVSRIGKVSKTRSLLPDAFTTDGGVERNTGISDVGAFYEKVIYRSTTPKKMSDSHFFRVETTISTSP